MGLEEISSCPAMCVICTDLCFTSHTE